MKEEKIQRPTPPNPTDKQALRSEGLIALKFWLPESDAQQNGSGLLYEFPFGILNGRKGQKSLLLDEDYQAAQNARVRVPKLPSVRILLEQAIKCQKRLEANRGLTRAALAKEVGIDPSRLTHILNLLKLAPEIRRHILAMPETDKRSPISERRLRRIARLKDRGRQLTAFEGFRDPPGRRSRRRRSRAGQLAGDLRS